MQLYTYMSRNDTYMYTSRGLHLAQPSYMYVCLLWCIRKGINVRIDEHTYALLDDLVCTRKGGCTSSTEGVEERGRGIDSLRVCVHRCVHGGRARICAWKTHH